MRTNPSLASRRQFGVTLIELIVFIIVISLSLGALVQVVNQSVSSSVDPITRVRLLEIAQSQLDEVQSRKFDENTPTGGLPACVAAGCAGIGLDAGEDLDDASTLDDVDDFHGYDTSLVPGYTLLVQVFEAGVDLGLAAAVAKRIEVTVTAPTGEIIMLSTYRANF